MLLGIFCIVGNFFRNAMALATPFCFFIFLALAGVEVDALATFFEVEIGVVTLISFNDFALEGCSDLGGSGMALLIAIASPVFCKCAVVEPCISLDG